MVSLDLLILDVCFKEFKEGVYTIDCGVLIEKMKSICVDKTELIKERVEYLWENNFFESSNGSYYLTDKSLDTLNKMRRITNV